MLKENKVRKEVNSWKVFLRSVVVGIGARIKHNYENENVNIIFLQNGLSAASTAAIKASNLLDSIVKLGNMFSKKARVFIKVTSAYCAGVWNWADAFNVKQVKANIDNYVKQKLSNTFSETIKIFTTFTKLSFIFQISP